MTPEKISNRFCLFPAEGWDIQTFEKSNANTFYTYLLNHGECCLAWLSVQSKISVADLKKNNFKRENPFEKGLNLFRPLLLLVTDGNDWYISTLEEPEFVKKPLKDIQQNVLATIQICLAFYKKNQFDSTEINQLRLTGISLNKQIKLITEVEKPVGTRKTTGGWRI
jgi:hypothetical protein